MPAEVFSLDKSSVSLSAAVAIEIPSNRPDEPDEYIFPAPAIQVVNFDDLYMNRAQLQTYRSIFKRTSSVNETYQLGRRLRMSQDEELPIEKDVRGRLLRSKLVLTENELPYDLPADVRQRILWFRDGVTVQEKADFVSETLRGEELGPEDFVIVANLFSRRSVKTIDHFHLFTRKKS